MRTSLFHWENSRRNFLLNAAILLIGQSIKSSSGAGLSGLRALVIGHTGRGDYGHGMDEIFKNLPGVEKIALADENPQGREQAARRTGVHKSYASYREALASEKPHLVSVGPRWTEEHFAMIRASLESGAHVFCEKPFTANLTESDELLAFAQKKGLRIVVAHQIRLAPSVQALARAVQAGDLGELVQMHAFGKQDQRAGGEDMLVLGTHLFDLMRLFAGDALACSAAVWEKGHPAKVSDRRKATEGIGYVLGDEIEAQFQFNNSVIGTFTSRGRLRQQIGRWRLELVGTRRTAVILTDINPEVFLLKPGTWAAEGRRDEWELFQRVEPRDQGLANANRRLASDWLESIEQKREPICSGQNAAKAVEMVMAVYQSALSGRTVELPLKDRRHPLEI